MPQASSAPRPTVSTAGIHIQPSPAHPSGPHHASTHHASTYSSPCHRSAAEEHEQSDDDDKCDGEGSIVFALMRLSFGLTSGASSPRPGLAHQAQRFMSHICFIMGQAAIDSHGVGYRRCRTWSIEYPAPIRSTNGSLTSESPSVGST